MKKETERDEIAEFIEKYQDDVFTICNMAGISAGRMYEALKDLRDKFAKSCEQIEETLGPIRDNPPEDIPRLKKQIKHCKNHLEEKMLRRRLNEATRNSRRRKA